MIKSSKKRIVRTGAFTLVELLVAMGVFAIIMLALMRFFASAQRIWVDSNNKVSMFEDARIALNLISRDLQCSYYSSDYKYLFYYQNTHPTTNNAEDALAFVAKIEDPPSGCFTPYAEVQYWLCTVDDTLRRKIIWEKDSSGGSESSWNFLNYTPTDGASVDTVFEPANRSTAVTTDAKKNIVIPYVVDLSVTPYKMELDSNKKLVETGTDYTKFPYAVFVSLTVLDKDSYVKWKATNLDSFRDNNKRTFSKLILLGYRGQ